MFKVIECFTVSCSQKAMENDKDSSLDFSFGMDFLRCYDLFLLHCLIVHLTSIHRRIFLSKWMNEWMTSQKHYVNLLLFRLNCEMRMSFVPQHHVIPFFEWKMRINDHHKQNTFQWIGRHQRYRICAVSPCRSWIYSSVEHLSVHTYIFKYIASPQFISLPFNRVTWFDPVQFSHKKHTLSHGVRILHWFFEFRFDIDALCLFQIFVTVSYRIFSTLIFV